jgi:tetratricopeptide (TPR) repeat protein
MSELLNLIAEARDAALEHRFDLAARRAREVLGLLPTCLGALRILGWAQLELEQDDAVETFERCAELDPEDALACVGQAIWYQQRGENDSAGRFWQCAWELDPDNQAIRRALVKLSGDLPESPFADAVGLLRHGHIEDAVELLRTVYRQRQDASVAASLMSALAAWGAQHEAAQLALAVYTRGGQSVKAALLVAALEDRAGRTLRSREAIARAEQADPGLVLFADVVRQVGLESAVDLHRATRTPVFAAAR